MKTNSCFAGTSLSALIVALWFSYSVAYASTCTPPPPAPVCYTNKTVPAYSNQAGTTASDGAIILGDGMVILPNGRGLVQNPTKQVQTQSTCTDPYYEVQKYTYELCLKTESSPVNLVDLVGQSAANNLNCMKLGTWFDYDKKTNSCINTKQTQLDFVCSNILGVQGGYDASINTCSCKSGYEMGTGGQCVESVNWCIDQHGIHSHILQYNGKDYCGCDDGYTTDTNKQCVLMAPTYCTDTYGINSHQKGAGCVCNDGYKGGINKQCVSNVTGNSTSSLSGTAELINNRSGTTTNQSSVSSSTSTTTFSRTLKYSMKGTDVQSLQQSFIKLGYLPADQQTSTFFGKVTRNAVVKFQTDNNVTPVSGIFGPLSQKILLQKLSGI